MSKLKTVVSKLPLDTFNKLADVAKKERRSVSSQIVVIVEQYIESLSTKTKKEI